MNNERPKSAFYWRPVESAPVNKTVIAYGTAGIRFMRLRPTGQWENIMNRPRDAPTHWMPLPLPPTESNQHKGDTP